ncbi:MAG: cytochrome c [Pyrinomonadaceae bacterium]
MTINRIKLITTAVFIVPIMAFAFFCRTTPASAVSPLPEDPAVTYNAKCAMCHSPKAEKLYDPAAPADQQIEAILKGKKGEKPPYMPAFEPKGITADDAKALVEYMQGLRKPAA